jgi:hypothetical protein
MLAVSTTMAKSEKGNVSSVTLDSLLGEHREPLKKKAKAIMADSNRKDAARATRHSTANPILDVFGGEKKRKCPTLAQVGAAIRNMENMVGEMTEEQLQQAMDDLPRVSMSLTALDQALDREFELREIDEDKQEQEEAVLRARLQRFEERKKRRTAARPESTPTDD